MFMPTFEDARMAESAIVAFCTALNTPVVNVEGLPVGPARAGILVSSSEYGGLDLWVRVRLISSDQGLTFRFQGDPAELGDHRAALAAALSFSEGMGFLFEEDMIDGAGGSAASRALRVWSSLFEAEEAQDAVGAPQAASDESAFDPGPDFTFDEDGPRDLDEAPAQPALVDLQDLEDSEPPQPARPAASGAAVMTKFRRAAPVGDAPPVEPTVTAKPAAEELARIQLASEELGSEYVDHAGFLSRVLGSF